MIVLFFGHERVPVESESWLSASRQEVEMRLGSMAFQDQGLPGISAGDVGVETGTGGPVGVTVGVGVWAPRGV